ncbi:hypothetical protein [Ferrovibrio sp.]|uniref:hypothetical protein n=1 Tax=Ferrovibrio sp. TaxID=1917215 RepID=UPI003D27F338
MTQRQNAIRSACFAAIATLFSLALACAAPFAALAVVAAHRQAPREALLTLLLAWLANQAIGYGLLDYPVDATSIAWGIALGLAAVAALFAAQAVISRLKQRWLALAAGFAAAFAANQAVLYLLGLGLPGGEGAFTWAIIAEVLRANLLGFAVLLAVLGIADAVAVKVSARIAAAR